MLDFALTQGTFAALEYLFVVVAVLIAISSTDDLLIDLMYWKKQLRRGVHRRAATAPPSAAALAKVPQKPLAIMVPAWKESDVIAAMIEHMVAVLDYRYYKVFVGTYANDPATIAEVERMRKRYPHVHRVELPHPGPTCKADCLNAVVKAILAHEKDSGVEFAGVVLHDSEDVLHPLELRYFNHLLPHSDMVQLPVMSLPRKWDEWVAGTYMDEFAESHKEMVVREHLTGSVPSAGVGTCFSRRALIALVEATQGRPFNTDSLTEDYEIGMRLAQLGMKSTFGWLPVAVPGQREPQPLSVAEYFPSGFRTAVRQKSRWVLGIGLQSWKQIPWRGRRPALKYLLLHDRKGVVTAFVPMLAYALLGAFVWIGITAAEGGSYPSFSGPATSPWFSALLMLNLAFVVNRLAHRFYFTARLYGGFQGLLSWPRMVVGNFVNCFAVARAWRLFLGHVILGHRLAWDKTMHDFPTADLLGRQRARLGELLVSWQALPPERLSAALKHQQRSGERLGKVLLNNGDIDEDLLADAVAYQASLPRGKVVTVQAWTCRKQVSPLLARRWRFVPLGMVGAGQILIGVAAPLTAQALAEIADETGLQPMQRIVRDSEIDSVLNVVFRDEGVSTSGHDRQVAERVA